MEGLSRYCSLYCVLKAGRLFCYYTPEEITAKVDPSLIIPTNKVDIAMVTDQNHCDRTAHNC